MQAMVALVKRQAGVHIFDQQPHDVRLKRPPGRTKLCQPCFGFRTGGRLKDRVRIRAELLAPQPTRRFIREWLLRNRIGRHQIAVAKRLFESTDFVDDAALLLGVRQRRGDRSGQSGTAIATTNCTALASNPRAISAANRSDHAAVSSAAAN